MMDQGVSQELVRGWIAEFADCDVKPMTPGGKAYRELNHLCEVQPQDALNAIRAISEGTTSVEVLSVLAAGPLENLLVQHGPMIVDQVIEQAQASERFRELLGGMWSGRVAADVWNRLKGVLSEPR